MHNVGLVAVDKELEGVANDEDQNNPHQNGCHIEVPESDEKK